MCIRDRSLGGLFAVHTAEINSGDRDPFGNLVLLRSVIGVGGYRPAQKQDYHCDDCYLALAPHEFHLLDTTESL